MTDRYVLIKLAQESLIGRIVDCNQQWLILDNITESNSGIKLPGKQNFLKDQILEIKAIENHQEVLQFESMANDAWYIYQMDEKYHKMIEALNTKTVFAMFSENVNFGRNSRMTILNFATEDQVFILDYINFQKIYKDLKLILEDKSILKIIFDSARICDYFKFHHKIKIEGIFDPLIVENTGYVSLPNLINKYFQINVDDGQSMNWSTRPLNLHLKYSTAKKTIYLRKLFNRQLLDLIVNSENQSFRSTSHNSSSSATSLSSGNSFATANQSLYSDKDEFVGEILVIQLEHEIIVGECFENSKYYLKLKNVKNVNTGCTSPKQELYKKHMLSVHRKNNGKQNKRAEPAFELEMPNFKINRSRPEIFVSQKNQKLQKALSDIRRRWLIVFLFREPYFQILTESTIYSFDMKLLKLLESSLEPLQAIKVSYGGDFKLSGFLDLKLIPDVISLEEFANKQQLPKELFCENRILVLETYFLFVMKSLFASVFLKCKKYSQFYCENDDWALVSLQMSQRVLPEL